MKSPIARGMHFLTGGLGNQLFQYAHARFKEQSLGGRIILASPNGHNPHHESDLSSQLSLRVTRGSAISLLFKLTHHRFLRASGQVGWSPDQESDSHFFSFGYHQTYVYLDRLNHWPLMCTPKENHDLLVHVRRGDYRARYREFGLLTADYYASALEAQGAARRDRIFLSSDEPEFAKEMLRSLGFKKVSLLGGSSPMESLILSQDFSRQVISNSTYSWWMSNLSLMTEREVVAPDKWYLARPDPARLLRPNWKTVPAQFSNSQDC